MKKIPSFQQFKKTFSKASGKPERRFIEIYGNVSFEEAYPLYVKEIEVIFSISSRIQEFEKFLQSQGIEEVQSSKSESRYYRWNGVKYRFSSHIYPTGSMTSESCIDFAADPGKILEIEF